jgi:hypothetical protein
MTGRSQRVPAAGVDRVFPPRSLVVAVLGVMLMLPEVLACGPRFRQSRCGNRWQYSSRPVVAPYPSCWQGATGYFQGPASSSYFAPQCVHYLWAPAHQPMISGQTYTYPAMNVAPVAPSKTGPAVQSPYASYYVPGAQPGTTTVAPMAEIPYYSSFYIGGSQVQPGMTTPGTYQYSTAPQPPAPTAIFTKPVPPPPPPPPPR